MSIYEQRMSILKKYYKHIETISGFCMGNEISEEKLNNIKQAFDDSINRENIIGFYDTTFSHNGKKGYLFTDIKVYWTEVFAKPQVFAYNDVINVDILYNSKYIKDCEKKLKINMKDGSAVIWNSTFLNKTPLLKFFNEIIQTTISYNAGTAKKTKDKISYEKRCTYGVDGMGFMQSKIGTVNKLYNEEKFHASRGHGYAAERANNLYDNITGHNAKILGDDNAKNGADRLVDGIQIQSKYCADGARCVKECFSDNGRGVFRYYTDGRPMQIEVPSDVYSDAVSAMKDRIKRGQVPGVTNPKEAENIIKKGHFTYKQARNIAKSGTVESITYDAVNGAIIASSALGVSAAITFAISIWNGEDLDIAVKSAVYSGLRIGGTSFLTSVIASQLSKAGLNSVLRGSSEAAAKLIGPKASATLINAFRNGNNIYGAAAMKSTAKLLRGHAIANGVTIIVLSAFDIVDAAQGRISGKQTVKNITISASSVGGGTLGWMGGSAIGSAICPGAGTIIGGLVGSFLAGSVAGKGSKKLLGRFIEDDSEEMIKIIQNCFAELIDEYLLNEYEAGKVKDKLQMRLDSKMLKNMFADHYKENFANNLLIPLIKSEVAKRPKVRLMTDAQMNKNIMEILENIED